MQPTLAVSAFRLLTSKCAVRNISVWLYQAVDGDGDGDGVLGRRSVWPRWTLQQCEVIRWLFSNCKSYEYPITHTGKRWMVALQTGNLSTHDSKGSVKLIGASATVYERYYELKKINRTNLKFWGWKLLSTASSQYAQGPSFFRLFCLDDNGMLLPSP